MKTTRGFVAGALIVVVALMFVAGGVYIYSKTQTDQANDSLIESAKQNLQASKPSERALQISADLAWAKTRLQMETNKLQELKIQSATAISLNGAFRDMYLEINDAVTGKTDLLFTGARSRDPNLKLNTPVAVENRINNTRAEVNQILSSWQALVTAGSSAQNTQALQTAISNDVPRINSYLEELAVIVNNLTPANSGLTQQEITQYQNSVNTAIEQVQDAANTLVTVQNQAGSSGSSSGSAGTSSGGSSASSGGSSSSESIQNQQNVINQIQQEITQLEQQLQAQNQNTSGTSSSGNNQPINQIEALTQASTTSSGYYGDTDTVIQSTSGQIIYPPNPAPTRPPRNPDEKELIEGTNTGI